MKHEGEKKMSKKSEVLRLTKTESSIISAIRQAGVANFIQELTNATTTIKTPIPTLKLLQEQLCNDNEENLTLQDLVEQGTITPEDAVKIMQAYNENKSILLTGRESTGKKNLLKTLIHMTNKAESICILEKSPEIKTQVNPDRNVLHFSLPTMTSTELLTTALKCNISRVIIPEMSKPEDLLVLLNYLTYKIPVIFSMKQGEDIRDILSREVQNLRNEALKVVKENNFLVLKCSNNGEKFRVEVIELTH